MVNFRFSFDGEGEILLRKITRVIRLWKQGMLEYVNHFKEGFGKICSLLTNLFLK